MDWIVSLTPEVSEDPLEAIARPPEGASIVEVRADLLPGIDLRAAIRTCPLPVLVTLRSSAEGGRGPTDPGERRAALEAAREAGAALIDLEQERDSHLVRALGLAPEQVVLSWHSVDGTPEDLGEIAARMLETPARWVKVVPTATSVADLMTVLALHGRFNDRARQRRRLLTFAMGAPGAASRYLAPLLGPPFSFAAWSEGAEAAPGQLTIAQTMGVISHLNGPPQRLYGVVGSDVSRSLSPALHAAAYRALGLPYLMLPVSVPDATELEKLFVPRGDTCFDRIGLHAHGWAVTTPYKDLAAAAADLAAPRVQRAGAANTLVLNVGKVVAENTDADGIVGSLMSAGIDPVGHRAVVQGTGGAARGAAVGLHLAGADVVVRSRSDERAKETAEKIGVDWCAADAFPADAAILVNATPLGRDPDGACPFSDQEISRSAAVVDMVYADHTTALVARARKLGLAVADGREVLLHQGVAQFAAFMQVVPPKEAMRAALTRGANSE
jgi:3-dehydroquinate dehydratase/shikimate dehydrogenase